MANLTFKPEFILLGFSDVRELQLVHAALFLLVYLVALMGNLLIIAIITLDMRLHTPMYFFLKNLSILDLCLISVTVPKSIINSLTDRRSISFLGCGVQVFSVILFAGSELFILTAMSYDRYVSICCPLRYEITMNREACKQMVAASWLTAGLFAVTSSAEMFSLPFCGFPVILQFFCDIPSVAKLSCSAPHIALDVIVVTGVSLGASSFICILISYICIFSAVLRMPSTEGRTKAFSTCLPHLVVVTLFLFTGSVEHLKPPTASPSLLDLLVSMFYVVMPPTLNPLIYSLRNRDIKVAMRRVIGGTLFSKDRKFHLML
ncbi:olfactory receptor 14A2-like [Ornithorhynchus anatinus]|uniref:Olfactory receptor n=1 Tax=Ornithorhynchus anatinus TaxID=9258 RepID=F6Q2J7_ORNAN|nr:olfactory receptor 14A2-like [Ornithorhynchus anatinus]